MSVRSKNPFEPTYNNSLDDDLEFGNRFGNKESSYSLKNSEENDLKQLQAKIGHVENESLESTYRALRSLNETREVGVKTAEELVRQGEKLNNINEKLNDVNQTLNTTQKNINSMKSIFGGIRNKFFNWSSNNVNVDKLNAKSSQLPKSNSSNSVVNKQTTTGGQQKADFVTITGSDREKELERNLNEMSSGLEHLKNLAKDMNQELERQDPIIDSINNKAQITKDRINLQNEQMRKLR